MEKADKEQADKGEAFWQRSTEKRMVGISGFHGGAAFFIQKNKESEDLL